MYKFLLANLKMFKSDISKLVKSFNILFVKIIIQQTIVFEAGFLYYK
jgi:hypothetical protein